MQKKKQSAKNQPKQRSSSPGSEDPGELTEKEASGKGLPPYAKYSGLAFQLIAVILIFYWVGSRLDARAGNEKAVYTALMSLIGVFAGLYLSLKDFIFPEK